MLPCYVLLDLETTGGNPVHDRITEFSTPVSGAYWWVPSLESLGEVLG